MLQVLKDTYLNSAFPHNNYGADEILRLNATSSIALQFENPIGTGYEIRLFVADAWIPHVEYLGGGSYHRLLLTVSLYSFSMDEGYGTEVEPLISQSFNYASLSTLPLPLEVRTVSAFIHLAPLKRRMVSIPLTNFFNAGNFVLIEPAEEMAVNFFSRQTRTAFIPYTIPTVSLQPPALSDFVYDTRIDDYGVYLQAWERKIPIAVRGYLMQTLSYIDLSTVWFEVYVFDMITGEEHYYTSLLPTPVGNNWYYIDMSRVNMKRTQYVRLKPVGSTNDIFLSFHNRYLRL